MHVCLNYCLCSKVKSVQSKLQTFPFWKPELNEIVFEMAQIVTGIVLYVRIQILLVLACFVAYIV